MRVFLKKRLVDRKMDPGFNIKGLRLRFYILWGSFCTKILGYFRNNFKVKGLSRIFRGTATS